MPAFKNEIHELEATGLDQIWVGDVTYLYVNGDPRYLAVVLDKYSRRIIGWSLSKRRNAKLTLTAIKHAAKKRVVGWPVFSLRQRARVSSDEVSKLDQRE